MLTVALVPILMIVGAAVDFARVGLAQARLQEAVDSAALAGRRGMSRDDISTAIPHVNAFMDFNFSKGLYGTGLLNIETTKPETGVVRVKASTTLDATLLAMIGKDRFAIEAVGEATQNLDNVDIVLVLDTTGSMGQYLDGRKKIETLKDAVQSLYDELKPAQEQLKAQNLRLRIGVVPYSSTVNVGKVLRSKSTSYVRGKDLKYYHWSRKGNNWEFGQVSYNLQGYLGNGALGNKNGHSNHQNARWSGCIEERETLNDITANDSRNAAPADAYDLNIDLIPNSDPATQWTPYVYDPLNGDPNTNCPSEVTQLSELSQSDITTIKNELVAQGSTYHDIGMIWGTRLISNGGVFGTNNPNNYNGRPVNRHIIYMTDGEMSAPTDYCARELWSYCFPSKSDHSAAYSAYGIEAYDKRVGASNSNDNNARHTKRFLIACNEAKTRNVSIWTIAFATGNDASLTKCASNDDQAFTVADSNTLISKFAEIGRNIGALRISE